MKWDAQPVGIFGSYDLASMSVAEFVKQFFDILGKAGINAFHQLEAAEVPNAIPFDEDTLRRPYDPTIVNAWWRILLSTQRVMQVFPRTLQGQDTADWPHVGNG